MPSWNFLALSFLYVSISRSLPFPFFLCSFCCTVFLPSPPIISFSTIFLCYLSTSHSCFFSPFSLSLFWDTFPCLLSLALILSLPVCVSLFLLSSRIFSTFPSTGSLSNFSFSRAYYWSAYENFPAYSPEILGKNYLGGLMGQNESFRQ